MNRTLEGRSPEYRELLYHIPTHQVCAVKRSNLLGAEVFDTVETADCSTISALASEFRPATGAEVDEYYRAVARISPCLLHWS